MLTQFGSQEPPKHWTKSGDFKEPDIPPQFTTVEFFRKLVTLLAPGGAIAINVAVRLLFASNDNGCTNRSRA
eukprot:SAG31_NODE_174_length_21353_cov_23.387974_4_plen_72_part_00